jgi:tetratricopeptide (TPR) repeat protein
MVGDGDKPSICPECAATVPAGSEVCPNCGAAVGEVSRTLTSGFTSVLNEKDWERFAPGNVFANRYTIIEEIGHGGMGRVFKAIDRSLGITVAIKIIRPEYASNPRIVELFRRETVLARSISSENVVRVHDLGEAENTKYISMDFVEGQNLRDLIYASGSLTISTAVKFGQQICSGLAAAHKQGIIHRDLKPSNIMIDKTGRVRVMDFGLAKTIDREDAKGVRAIVGTPEYLSPEQARGDKVDQRTDIYALGLILYEMATGRPVFEAESLTGYIQKHCEVIPDAPSRRNHLIPAALDAIILRCLKKDRNERYQKVEDVCQALDRVVAPEARVRRTARSWLLRLAVGAAACVLIGVVAYSVLFHSPKPAVFSIRKSVAIMTPQNVTGDSSQEKWGGVIRYLLLLDLAQSRFLRVVPREKILDCLNELQASDTGDYAQADLDKIASRENVDFFVLGGYMTSTSGCRINIRIMDARLREPVATQTFEAAVFDEIQAKCDEISLWAKQQFALSQKDLKKDFDQELKNYTTWSMDALILFFQGLDLYEKGDFQQSSDAYEKALAIDKNFALAYARLAINYTYEGRFEEAEKNILKAMSLREKLTIRERLLIEGDYFNFYENDYSRAIGRYKSLLRLYPHDEIGLEHQGAIYRNTEEWDKAAACFEQLQVINPNSKIAVLNLVLTAEALGQYDKAAGILQAGREVFSSGDEFHSQLASCYLCQGRTDQALKELQEALSINPNRHANLRRLGQVHSLLGDYSDAEAAYRRLLDENRTVPEKLDGRYWLGHLCLLQGKFRECAMHIEEGLKLAVEARLPYAELSFLFFQSDFYRLQKDYAEAREVALKARHKSLEVRYPEVEALHLIGLCEAGLGNLEAAKKVGLDMEQIINKMGYPKLLRVCYHLEGTVAGAKNSWDEAVGAFSKALAMLSRQHQEDDQQAVYLETLASSLLRRGDLDSARSQYEKVISLTTGRLTAGEAYARSLYSLGRICQEKKETEKAKEYFQSFLNTIRNADVALPEVEDVRRRLISLS